MPFCFEFKGWRSASWAASAAFPRLTCRQLNGSHFKSGWFRWLSTVYSRNGGSDRPACYWIWSLDRGQDLIWCRIRCGSVLTETNSFIGYGWQPEITTKITRPLSNQYDTQLSNQLFKRMWASFKDLCVNRRGHLYRYNMKGRPFDESTVKASLCSLSKGKWRRPSLADGNTDRRCVCHHNKIASSQYSGVCLHIGTMYILVHSHTQQKGACTEMEEEQEGRF